MRGGNHSKDIREYEITTTGVVIGERLSGFERLITGVPISANLNTKAKKTQSRPKKGQAG
jgi:hypothetical protein